MVQTFLTHPDYVTSARWLDKKRLGKQRSEALQILNLIEDLTFIAKQFSQPSQPSLAQPSQPSLSQPSPATFPQSTRDIVQAYRAWPYRYLQLKTTQLKLTPQDQSIIDTYHLTTTTYVPVPLAVADTIRGFKQRAIRVITLQYATNAIVKMWMGYTDSLKEYINAHIDAWIERPTKTGRGGNNNMMRYPVAPGQPRPPWTLDPRIHQNHRAALIDKELTRNEEPWYQLKPEFMAERGQFVDYIWV
jgi:hypothetical protein